MKQSIVKIFTFSLLVSSISFISCVDNEKNLFNACLLYTSDAADE